MAQTLASDLIVPEVWGDAVMVSVQGSAVLLPLVDADDELVGQPGDTVHFPKFNYIGDAVDLTEGVAMTPTKMSMTDSYATIKEAGKAVELTDTAVLTAIGRPNDQARVQLALSIARKIDSDIRAAAEYEHTNGGAGDPEPTSAPLKVAATGVMSWAAYVSAIALLGDEYDPSDIAGIVLHSSQHVALLNDDKFISSESFGANAVITRGQVGAIGTVRVYVSDRASQGGTAGTRKALIIKRGAIQLKYKRRPLVETDRDILARTNIITTNVHYAVKRVDDRGVIVLTTAETAA
ncbi:major capsid protein [Microbacterium phage Phonegingi]|nr:major capsid protein [Microbacterium phage Phonegingi]